MTLLLTNQSYYLPQEQSITIDQNLINSYLDQMDTSESTKRTYKACVSKFIEWVEFNNIDNLEYETLLMYKSELKERLKARAVNTHLTALKDLFKYLERKGYTNYAKALKKERVSADFTRDSLTLEQVNTIASGIDITTLEGARAKALFMLLVGTGLRECECVRADIKDLATKGNKSVLYVLGKGETEKTKYVIIAPYIMNALQHYFKLRNVKSDNEPLFTSLSDRNNGERLTTRTIQRIIKGLYHDNGIVSQRLTTHSTRHTAITLSILNGASVQETQAMARHKDVNTTMIYFHNLNRLENNAESKLEELFKNL